MPKCIYMYRSLQVHHDNGAVQNRIAHTKREQIYSDVLYAGVHVIDNLCLLRLPQL